MIISLAGYMGSGKSHISKILSKKINFKILDTDCEISKRTGLPIYDIFQKKGELYFRKKERELLEEILSTNNNLILSLGGGTPAYYNNMDIINEKSVSIYLNTKVDTLYRRLITEQHKRPLIAHIADHELPEFIAKHLFERNTFYSRCRHTVPTDDATPEEIAENIVNLLHL